MADVFISYKREDRQVAERLSIALEQLGVSVWWDFELLSGDRYRSVIRAVIDQCRAAVVLWSERAMESDFVVDEAAYAKAQGKLCPARLEQVALPFGFASIHTDDLEGWEGELSHPGFQALVRALEARLGRKAKLGAASHDAEAQAAAAEIEAFKAAQIAGNASALKTFLRDHRHGVFASFVRGQIETIETEATLVEASARKVEADAGAAAPTGRPPVTPPPASERPAPEARPPTEAAPAVAAAFLLNGWLNDGRRRLLGGGAALAALILAGVALVVVADRAANRGGGRSVEGEQSAAYDAAQLHPDVRAAVLRGRDYQQAAKDSAARGRVAAERAEDAARRARAGQAGYRAYTVDDQRYEGGWSDGLRDGYGVAVIVSGDSEGDRYAGEWRAGEFAGLGVYTWTENPDGPSGSDRYEGEFAGTARNGVGVLTTASGSRYEGGWSDGQATGPGVFRYSDGRRQEGEFTNMLLDGEGVLWSPDGEVLSAGRWSMDSLTMRLAP